MAGAFTLGFVYILFLCPQEKLVKLLQRRRNITSIQDKKASKTFLNNKLRIVQKPSDDWRIESDYVFFGNVLRNALAHNDANLDPNTHFVIFKDNSNKDNIVTITVENPVLARWADDSASTLTMRLQDLEFRTSLLNEL